MNQQICDLIKRRRLQLLIHSIIYYRFDETLVSDYTWTQWAIELEKLQEDYPEESKSERYYEDFKDFDHSTGYNLPLRDPWAMGRARWMIDVHNKRYSNEQ